MGVYSGATKIKNKIISFILVLLQIRFQEISRDLNLYELWRENVIARTDILRLCLFFVCVWKLLIKQKGIYFLKLCCLINWKSLLSTTFKISTNWLSLSIQYISTTFSILLSKNVDFVILYILIVSLSD